MSGSDIITGTLDLVVLGILGRESLHGYAVGRAIRERSAGVLSVEEGVLYPALHRLEERGLLEAEWRRTEQNRRAKFYRLTSAGEAALRSRQEEWEASTAAVVAILGARP